MEGNRVAYTVGTCGYTTVDESDVLQSCSNGTISGM